MNWNTAEFL